MGFAAAVSSPASPAAIPAPISSTDTAQRPYSVGLSPCHKRPLTPRPWSIQTRVEYSPLAEYVRCWAEWGPTVGLRPWRRGAISWFTRRSRSRLLQQLARVVYRNQRRRILFLTLTYPEHWPEEWREYKAHLAAFWKRLKRGWDIVRYGRVVGHQENPEASAIWRLERQERGAPHYHLIIFGVGSIPHYWLDRAWPDVVGSGDEKHNKAGTTVEWPEKWKEAAPYVAKYVAKPADKYNAPDRDATDEEWADYQLRNMGRHWGVLGRRYLPQSLDQLDIPYDVFIEIRDALIDARRSAGYDLDMPIAPFKGAWFAAGPALVRGILDRHGFT